MNNPISPFEKWRLETIPQVGFTPEIRELLAMAFEGGRQSVADKQTKEALEMAISEIEGWIDHAYGHSPEDCADNKAIQACKEALAEAEKQEPVAWMNDKTPSGIFARHKEGANNFGCDIPLYTHPATWQSLSDDEMKIIQNNSWIINADGSKEFNTFVFARAIEQASRKKNETNN